MSAPGDPPALPKVYWQEEHCSGVEVSRDGKTVSRAVAGRGWAALHIPPGTKTLTMEVKNFGVGYAGVGAAPPTPVLDLRHWKYALGYTNTEDQWAGHTFGTLQGTLFVKINVPERTMEVKLVDDAGQSAGSVSFSAFPEDSTMVVELVDGWTFEIVAAQCTF